jgi:3-oxoacyl-[acyl-carrier protein] reductase
VTADTWLQQFSVDAMAAAPMSAEFARRHIARGAAWGRIIGLTSGGASAFLRRSPTVPRRPPR